MSLRASELQTAVASKSIDAVNREADRIRQERHQHCEPAWNMSKPSSRSFAALTRNICSRVK
jgi:hypothetical protein